LITVEIAEIEVLVSVGVPKDQIFLIGADAFDPPRGVDPDEWLAKRVVKINMGVSTAG
jgi:hypothetical protein